MWAVHRDHGAGAGATSPTGAGRGPRAAPLRRHRPGAGRPTEVSQRAGECRLVGHRDGGVGCRCAGPHHVDPHVAVAAATARIRSSRTAGRCGGGTVGPSGGRPADQLGVRTADGPVAIRPVGRSRPFADADCDHVAFRLEKLGPGGRRRRHHRRDGDSRGTGPPFGRVRTDRPCRGGQHAAFSAEAGGMTCVHSHSGSVRGAGIGSRRSD